MTTTISIKQLQQQLFHVAEAVKNGDIFIVMKHAKPVFKIEGILDRDNQAPDLSIFKGAHFNKSKIANPSKHIDDIAYGNY
jgi:antitoxin (DNA-binding transcriptional repressor) of toxin-antitoxin stability system